MYKIFAFIILSISIISCSSNATDKTPAKKAKKEVRTSSNTGNYWVDAGASLDIPKKKVNALKAASKSYNLAKKNLPKTLTKEQAKAERKSLKNQYNKELKTILGKKKYQEFLEFGNNYRNK